MTAVILICRQTMITIVLIWPRTMTVTSVLKAMLSAVPGAMKVTFGMLPTKSAQKARAKMIIVQKSLIQPVYVIRLLLKLTDADANRTIRGTAKSVFWIKHLKLLFRNFLILY